jgi:hypothetical protein
VQENVFDPVGAPGVDAKPPASGPQANAYAFSYKYPGTTSGVDWGDKTLEVGAAGWYLAIDDIAKVLYSLNKNDGRILSAAQLQDMEATPLGWDTQTDGTGYRYVQKNGGWGWNGTTITTSIALFGPGVYGALFINSDLLGTNLQNNWQWCNKCQTLAYAGSANLGDCPAGGLHDHTGSNNYCISMATPAPAGTQSNWRWCKKCEALCFGGSGAPGKCPQGGTHDHSGSGNYNLASRGAGALPPESQENWRWCKKCEVLAFGGTASPGACAAGGQHDHSSSGNYVLRFVVGADVILRQAYMSALKPK